MDGPLSHRLRELRACQTADDVLRKAMENYRFRQRMFPKPPPRYVRPPKPKPKAKPIEHITVEPRPLPIEIPAQMRGMVSAVADHFGVARLKIMKRTRDQSTVNTRHLLFLLIKVLLGKSSSEIGSFFFRRDHTTVLHAFRRYPFALSQLQHADFSMPLYLLIDHTCLLMRIEAELRGRKQPRFLNDC
jgi:Bacterial dnaA protein helix-turn-helix